MCRSHDLESGAQRPGHRWLRCLTCRVVLFTAVAGTVALIIYATLVASGVKVMTPGPARLSNRAVKIHQPEWFHPCSGNLQHVFCKSSDEAPSDRGNSPIHVDWEFDCTHNPHCLQNGPPPTPEKSDDKPEDEKHHYLESRIVFPQCVEGDEECAELFRKIERECQNDPVCLAAQVNNDKRDVEEIKLRPHPSPGPLLEHKQFQYGPEDVSENRQHERPTPTTAALERRQSVAPGVEHPMQTSDRYMDELNPFETQDAPDRHHFSNEITLGEFGLGDLVRFFTGEKDPDDDIPVVEENYSKYCDDALEECPTIAVPDDRDNDGIKDEDDKDQGPPVGDELDPHSEAGKVWHDHEGMVPVFDGDCNAVTFDSAIGGCPIVSWKPSHPKATPAPVPIAHSS